MKKDEIEKILGSVDKEKSKNNVLNKSKINSISKENLKIILKFADTDNYKEIILYSDENETEFHTYYVKKYDRSTSSIANEITSMGYKILMYYPLEKCKNWTKEDEVKYLHDYGINKVYSALEFATRMHKGKMRKGNNPKEYITHPINVAKLVNKYKGNSSNINELTAAAYLHDTIEDTDATYYELLENFGPLVASLVMEVTSNKEMQHLLGKNVYLSLKMLSMTSYALTLKLCDRLDNIMGLDDVDAEFREKYINETIYIVNELLRKRELNVTQLKIINDILINIIKLRKLDNKDNNDILDLILTYNEIQKVS